jgi:hypothetical protein
MRTLQCSCQCKDERDVFLWERSVACVVDGGRTGGDAAGEGRVVVDVEFEEVEEGVCYEGDCAVQF